MSSLQDHSRVTPEMQVDERERDLEEEKETSVLKTIGYFVLCVFSVGALLGVVKALVDDDDVVEETTANAEMEAAAPASAGRQLGVAARDTNTVDKDSRGVLGSAELAAYTATPHDATHGTWTAAQHIGVKRAIFRHSFRFAQRHVGKAGASPHLHALSEVANSGNVMRAVMCFALPHCTPTRAERQAICVSCHTSNDTASLVRWLSRGVDPNTVDVDGDSLAKNKGAPLLFIAARQGHVGLIDALLRSGADVNQEVTSHGATALFIAALGGHVAVVDILIAAGADVNKAMATDGCTPLFIAAQKGHLTVVTKLIAAGALVDKAMTTNGNTPLCIAAYHGHTAIVAKLLQHGADKSIRGFRNRTPLEAAQAMNRTAVVALIA